MVRPAIVILCLFSCIGQALGREPSPVRGYQLLTEKAYLPPDFDQETFDEVWQAWPKKLRKQAEQATAQQRREMAYRRYGLIARPGDPKKRPLQYVVDEQGNWSMNCLACHQGHVAGRVIPGLPNSHYALETLTEEIRLTKLRLEKKLTRMDVGSMFMPLGTSNGTTNSVMFGVVLMNYRDAELNIRPNRPRPKMTHHDHDAPPWWNIRRKTHLYSDGFAPKGHRPLMQFLLVEENGPGRFRQWEDEYRDINAYIESLKSPKYPFAIDAALTAQGKTVFRSHCSECHGTYGPDGKYPQRIVPIKQVLTDPVRLDALTVKNRTSYAQSWFAQGDKKQVIADPAGYVAPPLDGIWASAPYFHNGSVPTLWHVLRPDQRPTVWQRTIDGFDSVKVGLEVTTFDTLPKSVKRRSERRKYFDTQVAGKSAAGHNFPDALSPDEKQAVLEYLKTL